MPDPTATSPLDYEDRYLLAVEALRTRLDTRGMLTDSDILDAAERFTMTDLEVDEADVPENFDDYERLRDALYDSVEEG